MGGDELGGIGNLLGEMREATEDVIDSILPFRPNARKRGELIDLFLDVLMFLFRILNRVR